MSGLAAGMRRSAGERAPLLAFLGGTAVFAGLRAGGPGYAALAAAVALAVAASAVATTLEARGSAESGAAWPVAGWGALLVATLAALDRGGALRWSYSAGVSRVPITGAGWPLGLALLVTLLGTLWLAARLLTRAAGEASPGLERLPRRILALGAGLAALAAGLATWRVAATPLAVRVEAAPGLAALAGATLGLILTLARPPGSRGPEESAPGETRLAAALAAAALVVSGYEAWLGHGSYWAVPTPGYAAAALLGVAAAQQAPLTLPRRLLLLLALAWLVF